MREWNIYKIAARLVWLGRVVAADEAEAIAKAAAEHGVAPQRLIARPLAFMTRNAPR
jgi:hypothetical protein